jgi:ribosomal protein S14
MFVVRSLLIAGLLGGASISAAKPVTVAADATTPKPASADPDQQIKCRKTPAPGSLVRKIRICRTIAEWRKAREAGNDAARAIVGENVCSGGECRGFEPPDAPQ